MAKDDGDFDDTSSGRGKSSFKAKKPNLQKFESRPTKGAPKAVESDMQDQRAAQKSQPVDPFTELMAAASKNARFSPPQYAQGAADPNDPAYCPPGSGTQKMPKMGKLK